MFFLIFFFWFEIKKKSSESLRGTDPQTLGFRSRSSKRAIFWFFLFSLLLLLFLFVFLFSLGTI